MTPKKLRIALLSLAVLAMVVVACSAALASPAAAPATINASGATAGTPPTPAGNAGASSPAGAAPDLVRTDAQGAVEFAVTPLNLTSPGETLDFDISLNTHSVDLVWDLAAQSTLRTDAGLEVKGQNWPVGSGHHYDGKLTFPAQTPDGTSLLTGAKKLTLIVRDAGAPERVFTWDLTQ